jgi:hypothetical protein
MISEACGAIFRFSANGATARQDLLAAPDGEASGLAKDDDARKRCAGPWDRPTGHS